MALITIPFTVTGQQLKCAPPVIAEHAVGSIAATFLFSNEWDTLQIRTATFKTYDASYCVALVSDSCIVPSEVLTESSFSVSVRGSDGMQVLTTTIVRIGVEDSLIGGDTPAAPTPSIYDKLVLQATAAATDAAQAQASATAAQASATAAQASATAAQASANTAANAASAANSAATAAQTATTNANTAASAANSAATAAQTATTNANTAASAANSAATAAQTATTNANTAASAANSAATAAQTATTNANAATDAANAAAEKAENAAGAISQNLVMYFGYDGNYLTLYDATED